MSIQSLTKGAYMPTDKITFPNPQKFIDNLVKVAHEALVVLDDEYTVVRASDAFYKNFDLVPDNTIGQSLYQLNNGDWDIPELKSLLHDRLGTADTVRDYQMRVTFEHLGTRTLNINAQRFGYVDTVGLTTILSIRDLTLLKHAQDALTSKIEELRARNSSLDAFAHLVAHDLKNPVSSMVGFASLIEQYYDRMSREDILENTRAIIESGSHIKETIDALLLLARIDRVDDVAMDELDMHAIVEQVRTSLNSIIKQNGAHLNLPNEWHCAIGYAPWIEAIWMNYISNAVKYGGSPPHITLGSETLPDGRVLFWVHDNGNGLTHEEKKLIFRPFARLANNEEIEGTGVGLSLVLKILEKLGGDIYLQSDVGKGSKFGFILPPSC